MLNTYNTIPDKIRYILSQARLELGIKELLPNWICFRRIFILKYFSCKYQICTHTLLSVYWIFIAKCEVFNGKKKWFFHLSYWVECLINEWTEIIYWGTSNPSFVSSRYSSGYRFFFKFICTILKLFQNNISSWILVLHYWKHYYYYEPQGTKGSSSPSSQTMKQP